MNSNCKNKRIIGPSGNWDYYQVIGAKVRIQSLPVSNFFGCMNSTTDFYTISDIYFRISLDGKTITVIELEEYPGRFFTWKDLEVVEINTSTLFKPICGTFNCGQALCGYKVSQEASFDTSSVENSNIIILDENGNELKNCYIRFVGAETDTTLDGIVNVSYPNMVESEQINKP